MKLESDQEIKKYLDHLEQESRAIRKNILELCWYMRGSISYEDGIYLGQHEIMEIRKIIEDKIEVSKKIGHPIF